jgi:anti-sigma regulatory factor (Ser/Thr protein kinase)
VLAATLVASELVTNAVLHTRTPLTMSVSRCGQQLRVGVRDHDSGPPTPQVVGSDVATRLGMQVVEALCQDWGVQFAAGGKLVWAILPAEPDQARSAG